MPEQYHHTEAAERRQDSPVARMEVSAPVQEIISANPGYLVRNGTMLIFAILCLIMAGMYFIHYPDVLEGSATLTTNPLPILLKTNSGGRIQTLFAGEDAVVAKGQPIVELENATGYEKALQLSALADSTLEALDANNTTGLYHLAHAELQSLGEGQSIYNNLIDAIGAYVLVQSQHIYAKRSAGLQAQTARYRSMSAVEAKEKAMITEELRQADERFRANEKLYNDKVISRQEYYDEAAKLRQKKLALEQQTRSSLQNNISIAENGKQLTEIEYEQTEKENSQRIAICEQARNLQNFVQSWKLKYLIDAPFEGKVHFLRPLQVNENISAGEEVGTVIPTRFHYIAHVNIPAQGSGKIAKGQRVHLLLDGFPYNEYGYLEGKVSTISPLPQKLDKGTTSAGPAGATYRVEVKLPAKLITSYHREITFNPEMTAQARIITRDRNLLQRLLSGFAGLQK